MSINQKTKRRRFRFSIRAILALFALIAVAAGFIGRPISNHFRENRIAKSLGEAGAELTMEIVPPTREFTDRLLYHLGYHSAFRRIVKVEFEHGDKLSDELALQLASLPDLSTLRFWFVPVSNGQLEVLAGSKSLQALVVHQETKLLALVRQTMGTMPPISRLAGIGPTVLADAARELLLQRANSDIEHEAQPAVTDEGVLAFTNHPTLRELALSGCHVTDDAYRAVVQSLAKNSLGFGTKAEVDRFVDAKLTRRREVELAWAGVESPDALDRTSPSDSSKPTIVLPNAVVDLARLQYVLPPLAKWELRFPSDLRNFDAKYLLTELQPYADRIVAIETTPELLAIVPEFQNIEELQVLRASESFDTKHANLDRDLPFDEQLTNLCELKNLKRLHIRNAEITTVGLQKLIDSHLELDELHLPATCKDYLPIMEQSGVAQAVFINGPATVSTSGRKRLGSFTFSDQSHNPVAAVRRLRKVLRKSSYPCPADSPRRPEDYLLAQLRQEFISLLDAHAPFSSELEDKITETLQRSQATQVSVEELIARNSVGKHQQATAEAEGPFPGGALDDWQIAKLYGFLAREYEETKDIETALEMRARQLAWTPPSQLKARTMDLDSDLPRLCHEQEDSQQAKKLRDLLFVQISEDQSEYSDPKRAFADSHLGRENVVPMLAPKGKQLVSISSSHPDFEVALPWDNVLKNPSQIEIPAGHQVVYIDRKFFPVTVKLADFDQVRKSNAYSDVEFDAPDVASDGMVYLLDSKPEQGPIVDAWFRGRTISELTVPGEGSQFEVELLFPTTTAPAEGTLENPIQR